MLPEMAFLFIFVFIIVVLFYILPNFLSPVSNKIVKLIFDDTKTISLRLELKSCTDELRAMSMVDEFARYARMERQITKLKDQISVVSKKKSETGLKISIIVRIVYYAIQVLVFLTILYMYRDIPVATLPPNWIYPLGFIVSYPTNVDGAVSIVFWLLVCRSVVSQGSKLLRVFSVFNPSSTVVT